MTAPPRLKRDWVGRYVRNLTPITTNGGNMFDIGHVWIVEFMPAAKAIAKTLSIDADGFESAIRTLRSHLSENAPETAAPDASDPLTEGDET